MENLYILKGYGVKQT